MRRGRNSTNLICVEKAMQGTILSINASREPGVTKIPYMAAIVGRWGFEGDRHNRELRPSFSKPGTLKPNTDRHITILAQEVIDDLNQALGLSLVPGSLGENITTRGLGDLSQIQDGAMLSVRDPGGDMRLTLRVTEQNQPCKNLAPIHRLLVKRIHGRRGLLCSIESGLGHLVRVGHSIEF